MDFISFSVVDDHINYDGKINPGENVRLNFELKNNYSFDLGAINILFFSQDAYVKLETKHFFFYDITAGEKQGLNYDMDDKDSYLSMDVTSFIPDTRTIYFWVIIFDDQHHQWLKQLSLKVEPFDYIPNTIIPSHTSGNGDARFAIRVIDPSTLTGHSYLITVSDSINESGDKGFTLTNQTMGDTLLSNHPVPDEYAFNIPITDGFKVVEAYLPDGGLKDVYYEDFEGGHPAGFEGANFEREFFNGGVEPGLAAVEDFYKVELEFTNDIDTSGVIGAPCGQSAFRYEIGVTTSTGFFPCPFNVWKIVAGQHAGKLNVCFQENPHFPTFDDVWAPDNSAYGGFETLYIMASDYDATGLLYLDVKIDMKNVLYNADFRLASENSVVDAGDKFTFDWEYAATSDDEFIFLPTNVKNELRDSFAHSFNLYQNYPNPFNPTTTIRFVINKPSHVSLKIYNIMGQEILELLSATINSGEHGVMWDGNNQAGQQVSSGLYFAKLEKGGEMKIIKLMLIR